VTYPSSLKQHLPRSKSVFSYNFHNHNIIMLLLFQENGLGQNQILFFFLKTTKAEKKS